MPSFFFCSGLSGKSTSKKWRRSISSQNALVADDKSLIGGLIVATTLSATNQLLGYATWRSKTRLFESTPRILVRNGSRLQRRAGQRASYSLPSCSRRCAEKAVPLSSMCVTPFVATNFKGAIDRSLKQQPMVSLAVAAMLGFVLGACGNHECAVPAGPKRQLGTAALPRARAPGCCAAYDYAYCLCRPAWRCRSDKRASNPS
jgi:hypothetical protein